MSSWGSLELLDYLTIIYNYGKIIQQLESIWNSCSRSVYAVFSYLVTETFCLFASGFFIDEIHYVDLYIFSTVMSRAVKVFAYRVSNFFGADIVYMAMEAVY